MDQRYSIAGLASTGLPVASLPQVLETRGMFAILSDGNDANLAASAYRLL
jgi:hypothetical protein